MRVPSSLTPALPAPPEDGEMPPMGTSPCAAVQYQNEDWLYPTTTLPSAEASEGVSPAEPSKVNEPVGPPARTVPPARSAMAMAGPDDRGKEALMGLPNITPSSRGTSGSRAFRRGFVPSAADGPLL